MYNYEMTMKNETVWRVKEFDGGGMNLNGDSYEIFFLDHKDKMRCVKQNDVVSVVDRDGEPFADFGNPYIGNHPYAKEAA